MPSQSTDCQASEDEGDGEHLRPRRGEGAAGERRAVLAATSRASRPGDRVVALAGGATRSQWAWRRTSSRSRAVISPARAATSGVLDAAGPVDLDAELLDDPAGAARQQHDPVAEAHGLAHVVGDEQHA